MELFSRAEHGGLPVKVIPGGLEIHWPDGKRFYRRLKDAFSALFSLRHQPAPKITFKRYFRLGRYRQPDPEMDTLWLFRPETQELVKPDPPTYGIDLVNRSHEVRKIFYAGFYKKVVRAGFDPEELLQELYRALLVRNKGKCPFDPKKSSFSHYIHMVATCLISNYHRKHDRVGNAEVFGVLGVDGEEIDVAQADIETTPADQEDRVVSQDLEEGLLRAILKRTTFDHSLVERGYRLILTGVRLPEMPSLLGVPLEEAARLVRHIRSVIRGWRPDSFQVASA